MNKYLDFNILFLYLTNTKTTNYETIDELLPKRTYCIAVYGAFSS